MSIPPWRAIEEYALDADLVIGAVLIPGAAAPKAIEPRYYQPYEEGCGGSGCGDRSGRLF